MRATAFEIYSVSSEFVLSKCLSASAIELRVGQGIPTMVIGPFFVARVMHARFGKNMETLKRKFSEHIKSMSFTKAKRMIMIANYNNDRNASFDKGAKNI